MAGMHDVEHAVAHDHALLARPRAEDVAQLLRRLDLVAIASSSRSSMTGLTALCLPRYWNQVPVASAIESGSHSGASRQRRCRPACATPPRTGPAAASPAARDLGDVRPGAVGLARTLGHVDHLAAEQLDQAVDGLRIAGADVEALAADRSQRPRPGRPARRR